MWSLESFAELISASVPALRLVITLFASYPLAVLYRRCFHGRSPLIQHLYFISCGVGFVFFNYGLDVIHSFICIVIAYLLCRFLHGKIISVVLAYGIFMGYLLIGYAYQESGLYDISWTMPQCILTLRLIGLVFDVYDGHQPRKYWSKDQEKTAVTVPPSFLETAGYAYFFGGFLIGPQFPLNRYRGLIAGEYAKEGGGPPASILASMGRFVPGILFLVIYQITISRHATEYLLSDEWVAKPFWARLGLLILWYRIMILRYQAVWLIVEGSCILTGIAFNGISEEGEPMWDGVKNIRLRRFEFGLSFRSVVEAFNCNTNQWVFQYVFKRLRFLGNKNISHVCTLLFLAIWHGTYSGYAACFLFEFVCMITEVRLQRLLDRLPKLVAWSTTQYVFPFTFVLSRLWVLLGCTYGFAAFGMMSFDKWWFIYKNLYFCGWIFYPAVFIASDLACLVIPKPKPVKKQS